MYTIHDTDDIPTGFEFVTLQEAMQHLYNYPIGYYASDGICPYYYQFI